MPSRRRLEWSNGAVAYAFSAEDPESLRGPQFEAAWADEFCIWPRPDETLANLRLGLRRGDNPRLVVTDPNARYFGAELDDQSLVPSGMPRLGPMTLETWLSL